VHGAADHDARADARAHVERAVRDRPRGAAGPVLADGRGGGVVVQHHRQPDGLREGRAHAEALPPVQRPGHRDRARVEVERARHREAHARHSVAPDAGGPEQHVDLPRDADDDRVGVLLARAAHPRPGHDGTPRVDEHDDQPVRAELHADRAPRERVEREHHARLAAGPLARAALPEQPLVEQRPHRVRDRRLGQPGELRELDAADRSAGADQVEHPGARGRRRAAAPPPGALPDLDAVHAAQHGTAALPRRAGRAMLRA
jgi:hypothetical protein